jgi:N-acetyl-anhydromuramyl-L-alanine amidase AmpD
METLMRNVGTRTLMVLFVGALLPCTARAQDAPPIIQKPASPHNYQSLSSRSITSIVIHKAEGPTARSAWAWFQNPAARVSAHYCVDTDGTVYQMVPDKDVAWHAGNTQYNNHGIGIENAGYSAKDDISDKHMRGLARLTRYLCDKYKIPKDRAHIVGHNEVPDPDHKGRFGGRNNHTDPGKHFDWALFMKYVLEEDTNAPAAAPTLETPRHHAAPAEALPPPPPAAEAMAPESTPAPESGPTPESTPAATTAAAPAASTASAASLGTFFDSLLQRLESLVGGPLAGADAGGLPLPTAAAPATAPVRPAAPPAPVVKPAGPRSPGMTGALATARRD